MSLIRAHNVSLVQSAVKEWEEKKLHWTHMVDQLRKAGALRPADRITHDPKGRKISKRGELLHLPLHPAGLLTINTANGSVLLGGA